MMPRAKIRNTPAPATGRNASAACDDVWMSVTPPACSVAAVVTTMNSATMFDRPIPIAVSQRIRLNSARACSGARFSGRAPGRSLTSSTSSSACQKNR